MVHVASPAEAGEIVLVLVMGYACVDWVMFGKMRLH
jgi:hypothetical protein